MSADEFIPFDSVAKKPRGRPRKKPVVGIAPAIPAKRGRPSKNAPPEQKKRSRVFERPTTVALKYSDGRTIKTQSYDAEAWLPIFLKHLSLWGNVTAAAEYAGISRRTAKRAYDERPDVREMWHDAIEEAADRLEMDIRERSHKSDLLAMFLMKALRPEKFREKYEVQQTVQHDYVVEIGNEPIRGISDVSPSAFIEADAIDRTTTKILPE